MKKWLSLANTIGLTVMHLTWSSSSFADASSVETAATPAESEELSLEGIFNLRT